MLLPMLLYILPAAISYRYLQDQQIIPHTYYGSKTNSITNIVNFPHHVLIVYGSKYCSGSLIYSKIVLTAASCFIKNKGEAVIVKVGSNSMTGIGQIIPVMEYKIHEYFEQLGALDNDIALLVLKNNVVFGSSVIKAVFAEPEIALRVGTQIWITGWGGTPTKCCCELIPTLNSDCGLNQCSAKCVPRHTGVPWSLAGVPQKNKNMPLKYLNYLIKVETTVLSKSECKHLHGNMITPSNFCVKYKSELILNDNGGGALCDEILVGVLSRRVTNKDNFSTAILTNVSYFHRWITLNTKRFLTKYCEVKEDSFFADTELDET